VSHLLIAIIKIVDYTILIFHNYYDDENILRNELRKTVNFVNFPFCIFNLNALRYCLNRK
jgi:hypothetical protein